jgi:phosphoglucomutase
MYQILNKDKNIIIKVVDPVKDYVQLMKEYFNFDLIKSLV